MINLDFMFMKDDLSKEFGLLHNEEINGMSMNITGSCVTTAKYSRPRLVMHVTRVRGKKNACTIFCLKHIWRCVLRWTVSIKKGVLKRLWRRVSVRLTVNRVAVLAFRVPPHCLLSVEINVYWRSAIPKSVNILRRMRLQWQWILWQWLSEMCRCLAC